MWPWNGPLERGMSGTRELIRSIPATAGSNNGAGGRGRVCRASQEYLARWRKEGLDKGAEEGKAAAAGFSSPSSSVRFLVSVKSLHAINARLAAFPRFRLRLRRRRFHVRGSTRERDRDTRCGRLQPRRPLPRGVAASRALARSRTEEKFDGWFLHRTTPPPPPQLRV